MTHQRPISPLKAFLTKLVLCLGWLITKLPFSLQISIGKALGWLLLIIAKRRRHIAQTNIDLAFKDYTREQRQNIIREHFISLGISLIEIPNCWWGSDSKLKNLAQIHGIEHLEQAQRNNEGIILLSAHFTHLEIAGRLLAMHAPFFVMYRPHENPILEQVMSNSRQKRFSLAIKRSEVKTMLKSLKDGHTVWYAPDQNFGLKNSIFSPFFGIPAATNTATSRFARISGAKVIPFFSSRIDDKYQLTILPPLTDFPTEDIQKDTDRINKLIEDHVKLAPEQYLWSHRRYKDRPDNEPGLY
ncbi:MAG: LpxL/LpxP family Kdo(2)-lipid IV(A) lauroyl/palmitoleoyl acyltransferase [Gammaproteobacteria bacterium]|nr:MAG: LpxL/LpxP family Kdo(2)-lipid IV(A) lauroyl/palmitoleoyl acyltransferase [Gammaproteobacteria bacterium]